ncbi:MAG: hypothetical protein NWE93_11285 [Candidatus Bathyarchaeota archaeon]|nr:hypothetical protein [Candidatus Bathyarchaeota archaeon]
MMSQQTTQTKTPQITPIKCENASPIREGRIYCWRLQEWVHIENCTCSPVNRQRASMEW